MLHVSRYVASMDCGIVQSPHPVEQSSARAPDELESATELSLEEALMIQQSMEVLEDASENATLSCAFEIDSYEIPSLPDVGIYVAAEW